MNENQSSIEENFHNFAKFGDIKSTGKHMTSKNFDKWLKESKVIDGKTIKSTDTDIAFTKIVAKKPKGSNKTIEFTDLDNVLWEIADHVVKDTGKKKKDMTEEERITLKNDIYNDLINKISQCSHPKVQNIGVVRTDVVSRLTDASKYTGTHKERFDEQGKGKGLDGRLDKTEHEGYVQGYKGGTPARTANNGVQQNNGHNHVSSHKNHIQHPNHSTTTSKSPLHGK